MDDETMPTAADQGAPVSVAALLRREGFEPHPDLELEPAEYDEEEDYYDRLATLGDDRPRRVRRTLVAVGVAVAASAVIGTVLIIGTTGQQTPTTSGPAIGAPVVSTPTPPATPTPDAATPATGADAPAPQTTQEKPAKAPVVAPQIQVVDPAQQPAGTPADQQTQAPPATEDKSDDGAGQADNQKADPTTTPPDSGKGGDTRKPAETGGLPGLLNTLFGG